MNAPRRCASAEFIRRHAVVSVADQPLQLLVRLLRHVWEARGLLLRSLRVADEAHRKPEVARDDALRQPARPILQTEQPDAQPRVKLGVDDAAEQRGLPDGRKTYHHRQI